MVKVCGPAWASFLLVGAAALAGGAAHAAAFQNGSFESALGPNGTLTAGSTFITGWVVTTGTIDYLNNTPWHGTDGPHSIDLDGNSSRGAGGVRQTFDTVAGRTYDIQFDLAGNPAAGPAVKTVRVSAAASQTDFTFNTTGKSFANMGWQLTSFSFLATAASTTLTFQSLTGTGYGPVIDNVRVSSVPEPSTGLMLGCGLLGMTSARLRRFATRM